MKSKTIAGIVCLFVGMLCAFEPKVMLSKDSLQLGDTLLMTVIFPQDSLRSVTLVDPQEWMGAVRFRNISDVFSPDGHAFALQLSLYETPICTIPPIAFRVEHADSTIDTIQTAPFLVRVPSLFEGLDSTELMDITTAGLPEPFRAGKIPLWWIFVILAAGIVLSLAIFFFLRWRKRIHENIVPLIPPYDEAIQTLEQLTADDLISAGEYKIYVFRLSDLFKRYIGRRYDAIIQESTSAEFKKWVSQSTLSRELRSDIDRFIAETDPVKFADITPAVQTLHEMLTLVTHFIHETRPVDVETGTEKEVSQ